MIHFGIVRFRKSFILTNLMISEDIVKQRYTHPFSLWTYIHIMMGGIKK